MDVELASNLVWLVAACSLIVLTYRGVRAGSVQLSLPAAILLALLLCFILLPVISVSDDLLAMRQATLPESEQSWRMASHDTAVSVEISLAVAAYLWLLSALKTGTRRYLLESRVVRPMAVQLARLQRLRPPPSFAY